MAFPAEPSPLLSLLTLAFPLGCLVTALALRLPPLRPSQAPRPPWLLAWLTPLTLLDPAASLLALLEAFLLASTLGLLERRLLPRTRQLSTSQALLALFGLALPLHLITASALPGLAFALNSASSWLNPSARAGLSLLLPPLLALHARRNGLARGFTHTLAPLATGAVLLLAWRRGLTLHLNTAFTLDGLALLEAPAASLCFLLTGLIWLSLPTAWRARPSAPLPPRGLAADQAPRAARLSPASLGPPLPWLGLLATLALMPDQLLTVGGLTLLAFLPARLSLRSANRLSALLFHAIPLTTICLSPLLSSLAAPFWPPLEPLGLPALAAGLLAQRLAPCSLSFSGLARPALVGPILAPALALALTLGWPNLDSFARDLVQAPRGPSAASATLIRPGSTASSAVTTENSKDSSTGLTNSLERLEAPLPGQPLPTASLQVDSASSLPQALLLSAAQLAQPAAPSSLPGPIAGNRRDTATDIAGELEHLRRWKEAISQVLAAPPTQPPPRAMAALQALGYTLRAISASPDRPCLEVLPVANRPLAPRLFHCGPTGPRLVAPLEAFSPARPSSVPGLVALATVRPFSALLLVPRPDQDLTSQNKTAFDAIRQAWRETQLLRLWPDRPWWEVEASASGSLLLTRHGRPHVERDPLEGLPGTLQHTASGPALRLGPLELAGLLSDRLGPLPSRPLSLERWLGTLERQALTAGRGNTAPFPPLERLALTHILLPELALASRHGSALPPTSLRWLARLLSLRLEPALDQAQKPVWLLHEADLRPRGVGIWVLRPGSPTSQGVLAPASVDEPGASRIAWHFFQTLPVALLALPDTSRLASPLNEALDPPLGALPRAGIATMREALETPQPGSALGPHPPWLLIRQTPAPLAAISAATSAANLEAFLLSSKELSPAAAQQATQALGPALSPWAQPPLLQAGSAVPPAAGDGAELAVETTVPGSTAELPSSLSLNLSERLLEEVDGHPDKRQRLAWYQGVGVAVRGPAESTFLWERVDLKAPIERPRALALMGLHLTSRAIAPIRMLLGMTNGRLRLVDTGLRLQLVARGDDWFCAASATPLDGQPTGCWRLR